MKKRWFVRVRRDSQGIAVEGWVTASSPTEAFLKLVKRKKIWPRGAHAHLQHFPGGHTYHAWPTWVVRGGMSLGDMHVARIIPEEELKA
jgi:hypothetical protein